MNIIANNEDRIISADLLDDIIDQFDGDDMAIDLAGSWSDDDFDGDDDDDRLSGGVGDDVLFLEA